MGGFDKPKNKIVVTGGSGFVGTSTIQALEKQGYRVFNYDLKEGYDIRDYSLLQKVVEPGDKILHLAAVARFADADADPLHALEVNVTGSENVARAAREKGAERVVYSSTGSVYMPVELEPPITEDFPARGNSIYGVTKYMGELTIKKHDVPSIMLRYAHLYGPGKLRNGAIGGFIDRIARGLRPTLYGGKQSNDFTFIDDVVHANLLALEANCLGEVFNIGSGEELTTEHVFETMRDVFHYQGEFEKFPKRSVDPMRFVFDISKARSMLQYSPKYKFAEGISMFKSLL